MDTIRKRIEQLNKIAIDSSDVLYNSIVDKVGTDSVSSTNTVGGYLIKYIDLQSFLNEAPELIYLTYEQLSQFGDAITKYKDKLDRGSGGFLYVIYVESVSADIKLSGNTSRDPLPKSIFSVQCVHRDFNKLKNSI